MLSVVKSNKVFGGLLRDRVNLLNSWLLPDASLTNFTVSQLHSFLWLVAEKPFNYNEFLANVYDYIDNGCMSFNGLSGDITFSRATHDKDGNYIKKDYNDYGFEGMVHFIDNEPININAFIENIFKYNKIYYDSPIHYCTENALKEVVFALWEGGLINLFINNALVLPNSDCKFIWRK